MGHVTHVNFVGASLLAMAECLTHRVVCIASRLAPTGPIGLTGFGGEVEDHG